MKMKEFLECLSRTTADMDFTLITVRNAKEAIKTARIEEREKAIDVHMKCCGNFRCPSHYDGFGENICSQNCLHMKQFKELLNKESEVTK